MCGAGRCPVTCRRLSQPVPFGPRTSRVAAAGSRLRRDCVMAATPAQRCDRRHDVVQGLPHCRPAADTFCRPEPDPDCVASCCPPPQIRNRAVKGRSVATGGTSEHAAGTPFHRVDRPALDPRFRRSLSGIPRGHICRRWGGHFSRTAQPRCALRGYDFCGTAAIPPHGCCLAGANIRSTDRLAGLRTATNACCNPCTGHDVRSVRHVQPCGRKASALCECLPTAQVVEGGLKGQGPPSRAFTVLPPFPYLPDDGPLCPAATPGDRR